MQSEIWYNIQESNEQYGKNPAGGRVVLARKRNHAGFFSIGRSP